MSDFSDRPLVAGSLFGLRAFAVDKLGRLVGPSVPQVFAPDVNEAECRKSQFDMGSSFLPSYYYSLTFGGRQMRAPEPEKKVEPGVKHTPGILDCTCGFYAYFDGRNSYKEPKRVAAIIEGFGVCTMGDRGFRAQRARLVALIEPGRKFPELDRPLIHRNYSGVPFYATKAEALDAHPLSSTHVPSPDSDADFWTRSVR